MRAGPYTDRSGPNLGIGLIMIAIVITMVLFVVAFVLLVIKIADYEEECIQRNGVEYCRTVAP